MTSPEPDRFRLEKHRWIAALVQKRTLETFFGTCRMFNVRVEKTWASPHGAPARRGTAA